jgi:hypothetical protein
MVRDRASVGAVEAECVWFGVLDCVSVFVDEPVVAGAEVDQVFEVGGSAAGPVVDVVGV